MKLFSDSQPAVCSKHVLTIMLNLSLNVLIKKVLIYKKKSVFGAKDEKFSPFLNLCEFIQTHITRITRREIF